MFIICKVFCSDEWADCFTAAKIELSETDIKNIKQLQALVNIAKEARQDPTEGLEMSCYGYMGTPGDSEIGWDAFEFFLVENPTTEQFKETDESHADCTRLHVNGEDFWWSGYQKHGNAALDTCRIPISILDSKPFTKD